MKKIIFVALISVLCLACKKDEPSNTICVDFSDITVSGDGYLDEELTGKFISSDVVFTSEWVSDFGGYSNGGIYPSRLNDSQTPGIINQYSAYPSPNGNFAVVHYSDYIAQNEANFAAFVLPKATTILSLDLTNTTYVYWAMKTGDDGIGACRAYEDGDWFKVTFKGFDVNGVKTGEVETYLAYFSAGMSYISTSWEKVDLTGLGDNVLRVEISIDGTDKGEWGLNTPTYCCIDNITYVK